MAELLKCVECGKPVSSDAYNCPHCQTKNPKGFECRICQKRSKRADLEAEPYEYCGDDIASYYYYHQSCLEAKKATSKVDFEEERGFCPIPECHTPYITKESDYRIDSSRKGRFYYYSLSCSNCGQLISSKPDNTKIAGCYACMDVVSKDKAKIIDGTRRKFYFHPICYTEQRQKDLDKREETILENYQRSNPIKEEELTPLLKFLSSVFLFLIGLFIYILFCFIIGIIPFYQLLIASLFLIPCCVIIDNFINKHDRKS